MRHGQKCQFQHSWNVPLSKLSVLAWLDYARKTQHMETKARGIFRKHISVRFLNKDFSKILRYATKMDAHQI
jgi:hypothetical protein